MAENENAEGAEGAKKKGKGGLLLWMIVGVVCAGIGAAVPMFAMGMLGKSSASAESAGHGGHGSSHGSGISASSGELVFVPLEDVTVNLDEGRMNRYLHLKLGLQVQSKDMEDVKGAIEVKKSVIRNWLISNLSDKELNDIRGKAGQNMLRREIRDFVNSTLFEDHYERVYDVLFEEFNVQ